MKLNILNGNKCASSFYLKNKVNCEVEKCLKLVLINLQGFLKTFYLYYIQDSVILTYYMILYILVEQTRGVTLFFSHLKAEVSTDLALIRA